MFNSNKINNDKFYIDFKNKNLTENIICFENKETKTISLDVIVINLFTCEKYITDILNARENILNQSNNGKRGYFTFSYPGLGWVQYNHDSIQTIYDISCKKSKLELYKLYNNNNLSQQLRLHSIAALIIKCGDYFYKLYNGLEKARNFTKDNLIVYISFTNPFEGIINTTNNTKNYSGKEIIELYNKGISKKFQSLFP
jgi:hypothetical protein